MEKESSRVLENLKNYNSLSLDKDRSQCKSNQITSPLKKNKKKKRKGKKEVFHANLEDIINIWDEILLA